MEGRRVETGRIARKRYMCKGGEGTRGYFASFSDAQNAAKMLRRFKGDAVHAYACGVCGGSHVGGSRSKQEQVAGRRPRFEPTVADGLDEYLATR